MNLSVLGMACLGSFGNTLDALSRKETLRAEDGTNVAAKTDTSRLAGMLPGRALRQLDHFSRMGLLCALDALADARITLDEQAGAKTGIVLATGYGPASPTFSFLDSILTYGETMASPLAFSHSVHNIPAATIAINIGITGPCATICQLDFPLATAMLTAETWLSEDRVERVLVGAVDEATPLLAQTSSRIAMERMGRGKGRNALPIGEGAAFFCLAPGGTPERYGVIRETGFGQVGSATIPQDGQVYVSGHPVAVDVFPDPRHMEYAYGNIPVAQAFDLALALHDASDRDAWCISYSPQGTAGYIHCHTSDRVSQS